MKNVKKLAKLTLFSFALFGGLQSATLAASTNLVENNLQKSKSEESISEIKLEKSSSDKKIKTWNSVGWSIILGISAIVYYMKDEHSDIPFSKLYEGPYHSYTGPVVNSTLHYFGFLDNTLDPGDGVLGGIVEGLRIILAIASPVIAGAIISWVWSIVVDNFYSYFSVKNIIKAIVNFLMGHSDKMDAKLEKLLNEAGGWHTMVIVVLVPLMAALGGIAAVGGVPGYIDFTIVDTFGHDLTSEGFASANKIMTIVLGMLGTIAGAFIGYIAAAALYPILSFVVRLVWTVLSLAYRILYVAVYLPSYTITPPIDFVLNKVFYNEEEKNRESDTSVYLSVPVATA